MKVCLCKGAFYGPVSGADQQIVSYAVHLRASGISPVVVVTCPYAETDPYYLRLRRAGVPVICLGSSPLYLALLVLRRIALFFSGLKMLSSLCDLEKLACWTAIVYFRLIRPDVVHSIGDGGLFMRAAGATGIPVIYQELGVPSMEFMGEHRVFYDKVARALPLCSEIAALSPATARVCRERFRFRGRVSVLPLIVEDTWNTRESRTEVSDRVVFGFAARFERNKAPVTVLEAFADTLKRFPSARLVMVGEGEEETKVKELSRELAIESSCEFPAPYTTLDAKGVFMNGLDVFVLSSYSEGTPNSVIEAMAHSLPIIATAVGGVPDVVTTEVGIVVQPGDARALAAAMDRLVADPDLRGRMGRAARKRYEELFSPRSVLPLLVRTYERVASRHADGTEQDTTAEEAVAHPWATVRV